MTEKLLETIVQVAQQGGTLAVWLYGVHVLGIVIKYALGFTCLIMGVKEICKTAKEISHETTKT